MSRAASAQYGWSCPRCGAEPFQPCRTAGGIGRVTDTHLARLRVPLIGADRSDEWAGEQP